VLLVETIENENNKVYRDLLWQNCPNLVSPFKIDRHCIVAS
jgi:hypothetical protein